MAEIDAKSQFGNGSPVPSKVRIEVKQFGPIEDATVDIRPLTVFVGASNTGKTYLAILTYALHKAFSGFPRFPVFSDHYFSSRFGLSKYNKEIKELATKLDGNECPIFFSDLPEAFRDRMRSILQDETCLANDIRQQLERCFDLTDISELINIYNPKSTATISLSVSDNEQGRVLWNHALEISSSDIVAKGEISDMKLIDVNDNDTKKSWQTIIRRFHRLFHDSGVRGGRVHEDSLYFDYLLDDLAESATRASGEQYANAYYLPAGRTGIVQGQRIIASSILTWSVRGGLETFPELPTLSGVTVDFLENLILHDKTKWRPKTRKRRVRKRDIAARKRIRTLAEDLERETLMGQILLDKSAPNAISEFVYRPLDTDQAIRLSRASAMVSELAPVVIIVRGSIDVGDTLIFEEPEAHLHPAAQTKIAILLARLVQAGVRVIVTTHSDWLLKQLENLMRAGELEAKEVLQPDQTESATSLCPDDVGIWHFNNDNDLKGSTVSEIKFDRMEGIEPSDFESISEDLYNKAADLQNQFEEATEG